MQKHNKSNAEAMLTEDEDEDEDEDVIISKNNKFIPPKIEEVTAYNIDRGNKGDPIGFIDFYESKGWKIGKETMKNWKAAFRRSEKWESNKKERKDDTRKFLNPTSLQRDTVAGN
jgi:hypothetical protein